MVNRYITAGLWFAILVGGAWSLPPRRSRVQEKNAVGAKSSFVADGTNALATALLQGFIEKDSNQAFSPLGVSALLAILAEGAQGKTKEQLAKTLRFPDDFETVRETYKTVLSRLTEKYVVNRPEFRNWFYIYKNYTVVPEFRQILQDHYLTEVKDIDDPNENYPIETTENNSQEDIIAHEPLVLGDKDHIKVTLPVINPDKEELEDSEVKPMAEMKPIIEVVPQAFSEIVSVAPMVEKPVASDEMPAEHKNQKKRCQKKKSVKTYEGGQEDHVRTQMMKEAEIMKEVLGESAEVSNERMKETADELEVCEEEIEIAEEQIVQLEEVKEAVAEEIKTVEEIKEAVDGMIKQQEAIKKGIEKEEQKEEAVIGEIQAEMIEKEAVKDVIEEVLETKPVESVPAPLGDMMVDPAVPMILPDKIKVTVVTMSDEEVKQDSMTSDKKVEVEKPQVEEPEFPSHIEILTNKPIVEVEKKPMVSMQSEKNVDVEKPEMMTPEMMKPEVPPHIEILTDKPLVEDLMKPMKPMKPMDSMPTDKIEEAEKPQVEEPQFPSNIEILTNKPLIVVETKPLEDIRPVEVKPDQETVSEVPYRPYPYPKPVVPEAPVIITEVVIDEMPGKPAVVLDAAWVSKDNVMMIKPIKAVNPIKDDPIVPLEEVTEAAKPVSKPNKKKKKPAKKPEEEMVKVEEKPMAEEEDTMIAMEKKRMQRSVSPYKHFASGLSSNNIVNKALGGEKAKSLMIMFNGLYFKGTWSTPFVRQPMGGVDSFYVSESKAVQVPMMHSEGSFSYGFVAELDSTAIELPYEGGRYSLLVVLPNSRTGLRRLVNDLTGFRLCDIKDYLTTQEVEVCLPSFEVETTSKPVKTLQKFGINDVFDVSKADLSGISPEQGLFVQQFSQLVTIKVDLTSSQTNFMTASNGAALKRRGDIQKFTADRPFLFFVRDVVDNMVIVAGKVTNPLLMPPLFPETH